MKVKANIIGEAVLKANTMRWTQKALTGVRRVVSISAVNIERLAKQRCPVDTGRLRASVAKRFAGETAAEIGTNVEYAPYVEHGTRYQRAQPFLGPALEQERPQFLSALAAVIRETRP